MVNIIVILLIFCALTCSWRIVIGPTVPDRLIASDLVGLLLSLVLVLMGAIYELEVLFDVALVYAILLFADVLIMAKYLEKGDLF